MNEWEKIAESFDATRRHAWKECIEFIEEMEGNGIDIACGNGRHLKYMEKNGMAVGIDISFNMLKIARKNVKDAILVQANAIHLPFHSNTFDYAIFIAALHNIKERNNRIKALKEMRRILKKGGMAMVSVWSKWQDRWRRHFALQAIYKWKELGDIYIPWKPANVQRFYHLYSMRELKKDAKKAGFEIMKAWSVKKASKKHPDNHFVILRKV